MEGKLSGSLPTLPLKEGDGVQLPGNLLINKPPPDEKDDGSLYEGLGPVHNPLLALSLLHNSFVLWQLMV